MQYMEVILATFFLCSTISLFKFAHAIIPIDCVQNVTTAHKVCCPIDPHNGMVCGGPKRGHCEEIYAPKEDIPKVFRMDDRLQWPLRFIRRGCQCEPRFYGVSCEQCWFGWTGPDCSEREHRVRKDIRDLSPKELEIFKDVIKRSWDWPSNFAILEESNNYHSDPLRFPKFIPASVQYYVTFLHYYGSRTTLYRKDKKCQDYGILDFNHDGVIFPTWHRYYNLIWERLLGEIAWEVHGVKEFNIPYWDWVGLKECDICHNKFVGAPGKIDQWGMRIHEGSRFHNLTSFCWEEEPGKICVGCQSSGKLGKLTRYFQSLDFPDQKDIDYMLGLKHYFVPGERDSSDCLSFHMALEGFCGRPGTLPNGLWTHNKLHNMIQGDMQTTTTATNDPIFLLHHGFIDKLFSMWYRIHKPAFEQYPDEGVRPGHTRKSFMIGIYPLARNGDMFADVDSFGYDYQQPDSVGHYAQNGEKPVYAH